ncbi:MAG: endonuclease domain-containing protein [Acidimicrobiales bacterium]
MSDPNRFDPGSVDSFRIVDNHYDHSSRTATLRYGLDDRYSFEETITFETEPPPDLPVDDSGLDRALHHLHVAAGTSYYKAAAPPAVEVEGTGLTASESEFHGHLYDDGLREFALANGLPVPRPVKIHAAPAVPVDADRLRTRRPGGLLVPIGGGKDSMVLIEAVRHLAPRLFAVNPHPLVIELAAASGLELIVVRRHLAPELARLNAAGALNGHVPITAIVSLIAVAGSYLYGYDSIAMAIERSASEETRWVDGVPVNHQYSKSLDFEILLQRLLAESIDPGIIYGSGLRRYSELSIARAFSRLTGYHSTFCSCNTAYRQRAAAGDRWCGHCPKCRFVGLMLAPFLSPEAVVDIIGRDMFDDPDQVEGFAALMSEAGKPFECVGERGESAAALRILSDLPAWRDKVVVAALGDRARARVSDDDVARLLTPDPSPAFPDPQVASAVDRLLAGGR